MAEKTRKKKGKHVLWIVLGIVVLLAAGTCVTMKLIFPGIRFTGGAAIRSVTSSVEAFQYDPEKIPVGTVYHYVKSETDGSRPADVSIFLSSETHIEVFKIYPGANATYYVTADMDWSVFSPQALDGYEIYRDGSRKLVMDCRLDKDKNEYLYTAGADKYSIPIGHYPVHNFNFDLTSLNLSFRFLADPEKDFIAGIHAPTFDLTHFIRFVYAGEADVKYVGNEARNGAPCRKYSIGGGAFGGKAGTIWVNRDGGYVEDMEIPASDNPSWSTFKMKLKDVETMSQDAWNSYVKQQSEDYFKN